MQETGPSGMQKLSKNCKQDSSSEIINRSIASAQTDMRSGLLILDAA